MSLLKITKGYGTYCVKIDFQFLGKSVFKVIRESNKETTILFGLRFAKKRPPLNFPLLSNKELERCNELTLSKIKTFKGKTIFFVVQTLEAVGGVEVRLLKLFTYLKSLGWLPVLITEHNKFQPLEDFPILLLNTKCKDSCNTFFNWANLIKPEVIEFQLKEPFFFHDLNLNKLKTLSRIGVCLHGQVRGSQEQFDLADYRIMSNLGIVHGKYRYANFEIIPNFFEFSDCNRVWQYKNQSKAILISRISKDKLPSIHSFIKICKKYNIDFDIAGDISQKSTQKIVQNLQKKYGFINFIGPIDTVSFLKKHLNNYLFVGGVGQVPIEAGSFGIPVLIPTHWRNYKKSVFMTKDNVHFLQKWNFVLRVCPKNVIDFTSLNSFFEGLHIEKIDQYNVVNELKSLCDQNIILNEYLSIINFHDI